MGDVWKEKEKEKLFEEPEALKKKKKFYSELKIDSEEVEIKKLDDSDLEEIILIMRKAMFEVGTAQMKQIKDILRQEASFGAYVDRMLVGVMLSWVIGFDAKRKKFMQNMDNAFYVEEIAVILGYEGKGIREMLLSALENETAEQKIDFILSRCGENPGEEDILSVIEQRGTRSEKVFLKLGYKFYKSSEGLIAFKEMKK